MSMSYLSHFGFIFTQKVVTTALVIMWGGRGKRWVFDACVWVISTCLYLKWSLLRIPERSLLRHKVIRGWLRLLPLRNRGWLRIPPPRRGWWIMFIWRHRRWHDLPLKCWIFLALLIKGLGGRTRWGVPDWGGRSCLPTTQLTWVMFCHLYTCCIRGSVFTDVKESLCFMWHWWLTSLVFGLRTKEMNVACYCDAPM